MLGRGMMAAMLVAVWGVSALADIPGPGPRPRPRPRPVEDAPVAPSKMTLPVTVEQADLAREGKGVQAKVAIPRKLLARLAPGAVPAASVPNERQSSLPWWSTVIAGVAMSAGAVGVVFVARGSKLARGVAATGFVIAIITGGYAFADLRIPDEDRRPAGGETIILEIIDEGDTVVLTLPPA